MFDYKYVKEFPIEKLDVPPFERDLVERRVREIDRQFLEMAFGAIHAASTKGGRANLVDGHHRIEVLKRRGVEHAPTFVHPHLSYEMQATLYLMIDHRTKLSAFDHYRAERERKNPEVMEIDAILARFNRRIGQDSGNPEIVKAVNAVRRAYRRGLPYGLLLEHTLRHLTTWIPETPLYGDLLYGFACFFSQREPEDQRLRDALASTPFVFARQEVARRRTARGAPMGGGHDSGTWEGLFQELYDRGTILPDLVESLNGSITLNRQTAVHNESVPVDV